MPDCIYSLRHVTLLSFAAFEEKSSVASLDSAEETCSVEAHFAIAGLY